MAVRVGEGAHMYEVVQVWGRVPDGVHLGVTHGVVVDSRDNVYVHNRSRDAVCVFDREGRFLGSWGEEFEAGAHGLYLSREGAGQEFLYMADPVRHLVAKTTLDGRVLWRIGVPDLPAVYPTEAGYRPTDVAVAPDGTFYVCDGYGQSWVHRYDPDGVRLGSFGGRGAELGQLDCPHGVWVDTRGHAPIVLVADRGNRRIQRFAPDGGPLDAVTEGLRQPCCFHQHGEELFVPDLHGRVTVLDRDNHVAAHLGDDPGVWERPGWPNLPAESWTPGRFIAPHAACVDSRGDVYVAEWIQVGRVTKLRRVRASGGPEGA